MGQPGVIERALWRRQGVKAPRNVDPTGPSGQRTAGVLAIVHRGKTGVHRVARPDLGAAGQAPRLQSPLAGRDIDAADPSQTRQHCSLTVRWHPRGRHSARRRAPSPSPRPSKESEGQAQAQAQARTVTSRWWPSWDGRPDFRSRERSWKAISTTMRPSGRRRQGTIVSASITRGRRGNPHAIRAAVCRTAVMMHAVTMRVGWTSARTGGSSRKEAGRSSVRRRKGRRNRLAQGWGCGAWADPRLAGPACDGRRHWPARPKPRTPRPSTKPAAPFALFGALLCGSRSPITSCSVVRCCELLPSNCWPCRRSSHPCGGTKVSQSEERRPFMRPSSTRRRPARRRRVAWPRGRESLGRLGVRTRRRSSAVTDSTPVNGHPPVHLEPIRSPSLPVTPPSNPPSLAPFHDPFWLQPVSTDGARMRRGKRMWTPQRWGG
jgi:hypothetical protein